MKPKPNQFFNAIRTDPGNYGITGRVCYSSLGSWLFMPDDSPIFSVKLARGEFCIPKLDKKKWFPAPTRLQRMEKELQQRVEDLTYDKQPLWALKPGQLKLTRCRDNKVGIEMLQNIRVTYNDEHGETKQEVLKSLRGTSTSLT